VSSVAEFWTRTVTRTDHEVHIPAGSAIAEMSKAYAAASGSAQTLGVDTSYDDWARIDVTDDTVVIRFTIEAKS
jgi:hypothetical protein